MYYVQRMGWKTSIEQHHLQIRQPRIGGGKKETRGDGLQFLC